MWGSSSQIRSSRGLQFLFRLCGLVIFFLIWFLLTVGDAPIVSPGILPSPAGTFAALIELFKKNDLIPNFFYSLGLNLGGYIEAILISIPLGLLIGLIFPLRLASKGIVEAIRYVSLPAVLGLFIVWFGIGSEMKIHFLAFGIIIYLLPVVIQRVDEVKEVYLKTVYTIGANWWQTLRTVYIPSVISRVSDDIRVLTAISWTYIIISEAIGGEGGLGALIWRVGLRRARLDKVFALLFIIILVGILQDRILKSLDRKWYPYKYIERRKYYTPSPLDSYTELIKNFIVKVVTWLAIGFLAVLLLNELFGFLGRAYLTYLFQDTVWVVWFLSIIGLVAWSYSFYRSRKFPYLES